MKLLAGLKKEIMKKAAVAVSLFAITFVFLMQSPLNIWVHNGNTLIDSSVFRTVALHMQRGLMPYRDIFDHKGPLIYIYDWLGMEIAYWRGIWIIEFISLFVCVILLYKIARLICNRLYSCLVVLIAMAPLYVYFEGGNLTEEYAMPFIAGALYIFAEYFLKGKINRVRLFLCGFSCAAVCLLRANMISVWAVFCIAVLIQCILQKRTKNLIFFLVWFFIGAAAITIPIFTWLAGNGAFVDFIQDYWIFNIMYTKKGTWSTPLSKRINFNYFLNTPYVLVSAISAIYTGKQKKDLFHLFYVIYIFSTLLLICMSGMPSDSYGMILVPMMVYPIAYIFSELEKDGKKVFGGIAMYLLVILALPTWIEKGLNKAITCYYERENTYIRTDDVGKVAEFIFENSDRDDKITVWGNWDIVYAVTERLSASKYSYQFPIDEVDDTIMDTYFRELQENLPKMVIGTGRPLGRMETFLLENNYSVVKEAGGATIYMIVSP